MDILTLLRVAARRWYVTVPILLLVAAVGYQTLTQLPDEYQGSQTVLLLPGEELGQETNYFRLAEQATDRAVRQDIADQGGSSDYSVGADEGGIIRVVARSDSEQQALLTVQLVHEQLVEMGEADGQAEVTELSLPLSGSEVTPGRFQASGSLLVHGHEGAASYPLDGRSTREVLIAQVTAPPARQAIADDGFESTYAVQTKKDTPFLTVTATGTDPQDIQGTVQRVSAEAERALDELYTRTESDPQTGYRLQPIGEIGVQRISAGPLRSILAVGAVGVLLALGGAVLAESIATRAGRRPGHEAEVEATDAFPTSSGEADPATDASADGSEGTPREASIPGPVGAPDGPATGAPRYDYVHTLEESLPQGLRSALTAGQPESFAPFTATTAPGPPRDEDTRPD